MSEVLISQRLGRPVRAGQAGLTNYPLTTSLMYGDTLYLLMDQCGTVLQDGRDEAFLLHYFLDLERIPERIDDIEYNYNYTGGS